MAKSGMLQVAALAAAGFAAALLPQPTTAQTPIKFTLDFVLQGPQAPFFLAQEKGYYAAEGLNVTAIDAGRGSSDTVNRVVSGAYDIGFGDLNALIEFNAKNPGKEVPAVLMVYDQAPFAIITLKNKGIAKPADLVGKKAAAPSFDTPFRLFTLFAKANGFDPAGVTWANVAPPLREPMLAHKDHGVDLYSNAVIASTKLIQDHPKAVQGFVKATIRGIQDTIADPAGAIAALKKKDPLINDALELDRLKLALETSVLTADVKANGIGGVRPDRLARNIDLVTTGFSLDRKLPPEQVFVDRFLPPKAERMATR
jgi:NitT/TauT family transport system substrate-binding protein